MTTDITLAEFADLAALLGAKRRHVHGDHVTFDFHDHIRATTYKAALEAAGGSAGSPTRWPNGYVRLVAAHPDFGLLPSLRVPAGCELSWCQEQDLTFADADYWEPGVIVKVTGPAGTITVVRDGETEFCHNGHTYGTKARWGGVARIRRAYPTGQLPADDGAIAIWEHNGWFDLYAENGAHLDDVSDSLVFAVGDAVDRVMSPVPVPGHDA